VEQVRFKSGILTVILSVIRSDCPHDKTKTAETKIAKLGTEIVHHDISPINEY